MTDKGLQINATTYRQYMIDTFILITFSVMFLIILISIIYYFYKKHKRNKQMIIEAKETFKKNNEKIDPEFWGIKKHDMDKYKDLL